MVWEKLALLMRRTGTRKIDTAYRFPAAHHISDVPQKNVTSVTLEDCLLVQMATLPH